MKTVQQMLIIAEAAFEVATLAKWVSKHPNSTLYEKLYVAAVEKLQAVLK